MNGAERSTFSEHSKGADEVDMRGALAPQTPAGGSLQKMDAYISTLKQRDKKKSDTRYDRANEMSIFNGGTSHHIGDYLPEEELNKFKRAASERQRKRERDEHYRLTNQNRGHAMLKRLGWNEGQGLGRNAQGMRTPVSSRLSKKETNSGVGGKDAGGKKPWDPEKGDDEFDLYKKKMMLSYRYRPNPLVCFVMLHFVLMWNGVILSSCHEYLMTGQSEKGLLLTLKGYGCYCLILYFLDCYC